MITQKTITLPQLIAAVRAFHETQWPPMSAQWNDLKTAAVNAVVRYARENGMTVAQVEEMTR